VALRGLADGSGTPIAHFHASIGARLAKRFLCAFFFKTVDKSLNQIQFEKSCHKTVPLSFPPRHR
jgi:hypothetical protein